MIFIFGGFSTCQLMSIVYDYRDVFLEELPGMPPMWEIEFSINLLFGILPVSKATYCIGRGELGKLNHQLTVLRLKKLISPSSSLWGIPVLFAKKKDETLRMCIDYKN